MFETLLCYYFDLDYTGSLEIIHRGIDDRQFVWYYLHVQQK